MSIVYDYYCSMQEPLFLYSLKTGILRVVFRSISLSISLTIIIITKTFYIFVIILIHKFFYELIKYYVRYDVRLMSVVFTFSLQTLIDYFILYSFCKLIFNNCAFTRYTMQIIHNIDVQ